MLAVERAMVDRALLEEERGLMELPSGLQLVNLSTGGIPAGKSAERFLKGALVSEDNHHHHQHHHHHHHQHQHHHHHNTC